MCNTKNGGSLIFINNINKNVIRVVLQRLSTKNQKRVLGSSLSLKTKPDSVLILAVNATDPQMCPLAGL